MRMAPAVAAVTTSSGHHGGQPLAGLKHVMACLTPAAGHITVLLEVVVSLQFLHQHMQASMHASVQVMMLLLAGGFEIFQVQGGGMSAVCERANVARSCSVYISSCSVECFLRTYNGLLTRSRVLCESRFLSPLMQCTHKQLEVFGFAVQLLDRL
jgi:hypothetical protein